MDGIKLLVESFDYDHFKTIAQDNPIFCDLNEDKDGRYQKIKVNGREEINEGVRIYTHRCRFSNSYRLTINEIYEEGVLTHRNLILHGSMHCNYHGGNNFTRFTHVQMIEEVEFISNSLDIDDTAAIIQSVEPGLNVLTPFNPTLFVEQSLLMYRFKKFEDGENIKKMSKKRGGYYIACFSEYYLKSYDKGRWCGLADNLMRFEIHPNKMNYFKSCNVKTLRDLKDISKVRKLYDMLLDCWKHVIVYDEDVFELDLDKESLSADDKELLEKGKYRDYWVQLHKQGRGIFHNRKTRFRELMKEHSTTNYYERFGQLLKDEYNVVFSFVTAENETNLPVSNAAMNTNCPFSSGTSIDDRTILPLLPNTIETNLPHSIQNVQITALDLPVKTPEQEIAETKTMLQAWLTYFSGGCNISTVNDKELLCYI